MQKSKLLRLAVLVLLLMMLGLGGALAAVSDSGNPDLSAQERYDAAMQLLVNGRYTAAASALDRLQGYGDATEMAVYCRALDAASRSDYQTAIAGLKLLEDFKDTELLIRYYEACQVQNSALQAYQNDPTGNDASDIISMYEKGAKLFSRLPLYKDSDVRRADCEKQAETVRAEQLDRKNLAVYTTARSYDDAAHAVILSTAEDAALEKAYNDCTYAIRRYKGISEYRDAQARITACQTLQIQLQDEFTRRQNQKAYDSARAYDDAAHNLDLATATNQAIKTAVSYCQLAIKGYTSISAFSDSAERIAACQTLQTQLQDEFTRRQNQKAYDSARAYDDAAHAVDIAAASDADLNAAVTDAGAAIDGYLPISAFSDSAERIKSCQTLQGNLKNELTRRQNQKAYDNAHAYDDAAHAVDIAAASDADLNAAVSDARIAISVYRAVSAFSDSAERIKACNALITAIDAESTRRLNQAAYNNARTRDDLAHALSVSAASDAELSAAVKELTLAISQYQKLGSFSDAAQRISACRTLLSSIQAEMQRREKQGVYDLALSCEQRATSLFTEGCSYDSLLQVIDACNLAASQYRTIQGFSDAEARLNSCNTLRAEAQARLLPTRYNEASLLEAAALAVDTNTASIEAMNQAVLDLSAAIGAYAELTGYSDSAQRINDCTARRQQLQTAITRQTSYEAGLAHEAHAHSFIVTQAPLADLRTIVSSCENAINSFMELGGYRDSMQHLTDCQALQQQANLRIADHKLDAVNDFNYSGSGVIRVQKAGSYYDYYTLLDMTGKTIASGEWDDITPFSEGFAWFDSDWNDFKLINTKGQTITTRTWATVQPFSEGYAVVEDYSKTYYIDQNGNIQLTGTWKTAGPFKEGLAAVQNASGSYGFIDKTGIMKLTARWADAKDFAEGLAAVKHNGKWGFIDAKDQQIVACVWEEVHSFSEGLAAVKHNGKWGFIDKTGTVVIPCSFASVSDFHDGCAQVKQNSYSSSKLGYIDKTGQMIVDCKFKTAADFSNGLARVSSSSYSGYGFINTKGQFVIPEGYAAASDFHDGYAVVVDSNAYMSIIDTTGKPVY